MQRFQSVRTAFCAVIALAIASPGNSETFRAGQCEIPIATFNAGLLAQGQRTILAGTNSASHMVGVTMSKDQYAGYLYEADRPLGVAPTKICVIESLMGLKLEAKSSVAARRLPGTSQGQREINSQYANGFRLILSAANQREGNMGFWWQRELQYLGGVGKTGSEWKSLAAELRHDPKARNFVVGDLVKNGMSRAAAMAKLEDYASAAEAMSKPPNTPRDFGYDTFKGSRIIYILRNGDGPTAKVYTLRPDGEIKARIELSGFGYTQAGIDLISSVGSQAP